MSRYRSRAGAEAAYELRCAHYSWREVRDKLGYRSVGAAQCAVNGHVARMGREPTETSRAARKDAIRLRSRALGERFADAFFKGDDDRLVMLNRELARNDSKLAKLQGLYAPQQVAVTVTSVEDTRRRLLAQVERVPAIDAQVIESAS